MKKSLGLALGLIVACFDAGCISEMNSCATWVEQTWTSNKAWRARKWMYEDIPCESSFKAGFKAGYRFANCGGDSCTPPGPSHFWGADGMTEKDVQEAQAWCDGFTHGAMAAQQDGNQVASTLDAQSAQPPEGVPDVLYYQGPGSLGQIGGTPDQGQPLPGGMTPGAVPSPLPNWSSAAAPADTSYPPGNPASEAVPAAPLDISGTHNSATHYHGSAAFPGIGSLRSMGPDASNMPPPAPASEAEPALRPSPIAAPYNLPPSAAAPPHEGSSGPATSVPGPAAQPPSTNVNPTGATAPIGTTVVVPGIVPATSPRGPAGPQWELPVLRD
jgi:hypothetical protein